MDITFSPNSHKLQIYRRLSLFSLLLPALILMSLIVQFTSTPSVSAFEERHCVVQVYPIEEQRHGDLLGCFANSSEAVAFATGNIVTLPANATQEEISTAIRAFQAEEATEIAQNGVVPLSSQVVSIQWDWTNRGSTSTVFTSASLCSQTISGHLLSSDYTVFPSGWNDRVESAEAFAGCRGVQLWDNSNFQGATISCTPYCSTLGAMNNATSSSKTFK